MLDHHALGRAGRAGRVDHVRERPGRDAAPWIGGGVLRDRRPVAVDAKHASRVGRQLREQPLLRQQHRGARLLDHQGEALLRIARVERHVRASGLEDAEQADDHLERALDAQSHPDLGADALRDQVAGELVGARVELAIGQPLFLADDGDRRRRARALLLEELDGCRDCRSSRPTYRSTRPAAGGARTR